MKKGYAVILAIIFLLVGGTAMAEDVDVNGNLKATSITFGDSSTQTTSAQPITGGCSGQAISYIHSGTSFDCLTVGSGTVTSITAGSGLASTSVPITTSGTISIASGGVTDAMLANGISAGKISGNISGNAASITGSISEAQVTNLTTDLNNKAAIGANTDITSLTGLSSQASVTLHPYGTATGNTGEVHFKELAANGNNHIGFKAPDIISANKIWTLPSGDGSSGSVLTTNGSGVLTWSDVAGGTVTSVATGAGLTGGPITTSGTISIANGGITNSMLANSSVTINTVSPLSGGGTVVIGGSLNLGLDTVPVTNGGTGAITASGARAALGSAASGANSDITSLSGLTTPLSIAQGGTGSSSKHFVDLTTNQTIGGNKSLTGNLILSATTATAGIIYAGSATLLHSYGNSNIFVGSSAGNLAMDGGGNTGVGYETLNQNSTGNGNTASGSWALNSNTTGDDNTASGYSALYSNRTGYGNTASGCHALISNTTGNFNTAIGMDALFSQSFDNGAPWDAHNTAVGYQALYTNNPTSNNNGVYNTAVGSNSLYKNTIGYSNTAIGDAALYSNTTGNFNTATGISALNLNSTGSNNTANGSQALYLNTIGNNNTAVGRDSLHQNDIGGSNTAVGYASLQNTTGGGANTAIGQNAGNTNSTGNNNTFVGFWADATSNNLTNASAIGYNAKVDVDNKVRIGDDNVQIIGGHVAWSNLSDIRAKRDVTNIAYGLAFINSLKPVQYRMKSGNGRIDFGFVAQDVEVLLGQDYNLLNIGGGTEEMLSLRYTDFIAPMVKAMQEQQAIIEIQKKEIAGQREKMKTLEERLARIETMMAER